MFSSASAIHDTASVEEVRQNLENFQTRLSGTRRPDSRILAGAQL